MKIIDSAISINSYNQKFSFYNKIEKLTIKIERPKNHHQNILDKIEINSKGIKDNNENKVTDPKILFMKKILKELFGFEADFLTLEDFENLIKTTNSQIYLSEKFSSISLNDLDWSIEYTNKTINFESQNTTFIASGNFKTSNGERIEFNLKLELFNQFLEQKNSSININNSKKKDPLIINLSSNSAEISDEKVKFDIDSDGLVDNIPKLSNGSEYLALDKNSDGKINDGSELFGAISGDGLMELKKYDDDNNDWIDENDKVFNNLRLWNKLSENLDIILPLKSRNVGAIFLKSSNTEFELKNKINNKNAEIIKTGIFIKENGEVGSIQQLDFYI